VACFLAATPTFRIVSRYTITAISAVMTAARSNMAAVAFPEAFMPRPMLEPLALPRTGQECEAVARAEPRVAAVQEPVLEADVRRLPAAVAAEREPVRVRVELLVLVGRLVVLGPELAPVPAARLVVLGPELAPVQVARLVALVREGRLVLVARLVALVREAVVPLEPEAVAPLVPEAVVLLVPEAVVPLEPEAVVPLEPEAVVPLDLAAVAEDVQQVAVAALVPEAAAEAVQRVAAVAAGAKNKRYLLLRDIYTSAQREPDPGLWRDVNHERAGRSGGRTIAGASVAEHSPQRSEGCSCAGHGHAFFGAWQALLLEDAAPCAIVCSINI
jgi:hypothetical protein